VSKTHRITENSLTKLSSSSP